MLQNKVKLTELPFAALVSINYKYGKECINDMLLKPKFMSYLKSVYILHFKMLDMFMLVK